MPNYAVNCTTESAIYVMELPEFHLWVLPLVTWIDGFHRLKSLHAAQSWINKKQN